MWMLMCMCLEYCEDHWEIFLSNLVHVENIRNCIYFILFYWFSSGTLHTNQHSKCKWARKAESRFFPLPLLLCLCLCLNPSTCKCKGQGLRSFPYEMRRHSVSGTSSFIVASWLPRHQSAETPIKAREEERYIYIYLRCCRHRWRVEGVCSIVVKRISVSTVRFR